MPRVSVESKLVLSGRRPEESRDWIFIPVVRAVEPSVYDYGTFFLDRSVLEGPDWHTKHDGEWYAAIELPHEVVEHDGYAVPLFEGDVERREWEARRAAAKATR